MQMPPLKCRIDPEDLMFVQNIIVSNQVRRNIAEEEPLYDLNGIDPLCQSAQLRIYRDHFHTRTSCAWRRYYGCCLCMLLCSDATTRCVEWMCGFAQIASRFRHRNSVSTGSSGNPVLLIAAFVIFLGGILAAVFISHIAVPVALSCSAIAVVLLLIWWYTFSFFVSLGMRGGEWFGLFTRGTLDVTTLRSTVFLGGNTVGTNQLADEIEAFAEDSLHHYQHSTQKLGASKQLDVKQVVNDSWIEEKNEEGENVYKHVGSQDESYGVASYHRIISNHPDRLLSLERETAPGKDAHVGPHGHSSNAAYGSFS
eukprot:gb/GECG01012934.1/.p1 GENE.gb/GECG01012934.1/~~gb/GECG01012934.1/.p1  ORF type:complete len:311 (+),score=27.57 gb/GECG01012934.1/:1-933(+)